ncbi:MAG TPA: hypothetical protein VJ111_09405 [Chitinophagaceae bacterium]|nr:hypothetical protein [Chitinophagaceae bacterium]
MMRIINISMLIVLCSISFTLHAQSDSIGNKFSFKLGTYYNSNLNYYGRTDSLRSSGVFPIGELWFNNKFYINAAPVFTHNSMTGFQYAGAVATAGYAYNNGKSAGHIYFVKPIYKNNSQLVQSALKAQAAATFTWLNKIINITGGADVKFSGDTDYGATAGLDHIFRKELKNNSVLIIDPSAYLYAGTQQFTRTYYEKSNSLPLFPAPDRLVTEDVKKLNILSYEFSVPVIYSKGKWMLLATPSYVLPQNLIRSENRSDLSETGRKMFYITVGGKISF